MKQFSLQKRELPLESLLLSCLAVGILAGALSGIFFRPAVPELPGAWLVFLLLLLFSTSCLGVALVPVGLAFLSWTFACSVAVAFGSGGLTGILEAFFSFGLPLLLLMPAYVLAGGDCMRLSRSLLLFRRGRVSRGSVGFPVWRLLIMLLLIIADCIYSAYLLPLI